MLIKIENLLSILQIDIVALRSEDEEKKEAAIETVNLIIKTASESLIERIGYDPISLLEEEASFVYEGTLGNSAFLPAPIRSVDTLHINDILQADDSYSIARRGFNSTRANEIRTNTILYPSCKIKIAGVFGSYNTIDDMNGSLEERLVAAICYQFLNKNGLVESTSQGTDSTTFRGRSWLDRLDVGREVSALKPYTNCIANI